MDAKVKRHYTKHVPDIENLCFICRVNPPTVRVELINARMCVDCYNRIRKAIVLHRMEQTKGEN